VRPKIVDWLNATLGTSALGWLVPSPAVVYGVAALVVMVLFVKRCRSAGLLSYHALGATIWGLIAGLVGARLLYLLLRADQVWREPGMLVDLSGSTMSWGAYLGGFAGFLLYFRRERESPWRYADVVASVFGLAPFIARFACLLNGDDYGRVTDLPWAVTYPQGSMAFEAHARQGLLGVGATASLPVHPVQLYLAAAGLALFVVFSELWRRVRLQAGALFFLYWAADGATRFGLEFFRGDTERTYVGAFPDAQIIAGLVALVSAAAFGWIQTGGRFGPRLAASQPQNSHVPDRLITSSARDLNLTRCRSDRRARAVLDGLVRYRFGVTRS
jgi:phosphatidylglycerol:prolipoprotein diacylglycerol transferase